MPKVLAWLKQEGALDHHEFAQTFNTGIGMVCVVGAQDVARVTDMLEQGGETVYAIGELVERGDDEGCLLSGLEAWDRL